MYDAFVKLLNMSLTAGILVLVIAVLRKLLQKAPRKLTCILWVLAAVRLVRPVSISSSLSVFNILHVKNAESENLFSFHYTGNTEKPTATFRVPTPVDDSDAPESMTIGMKTSDFYLPVIMIIWFIGLIAMLSSAAFSTLV